MQHRQRAHDDPFERPAAELTRLHLMDAGLGSVRDIAQLARCVRLRDLNLHCNRIRHARMGLTRHGAGTLIRISLSNLSFQYDVYLVDPCHAAMPFSPQNQCLFSLS